MSAATMINGHGVARGGPVTVAAGADIVLTARLNEGDILTASAQERTRFGRGGIYDVTVLRGATVIAE
ncbi:hypothetical protein EAO75_14035 [Streptomyces sp. uw30]|nr:hypothetical protein EAO75_14035 [Streptomyces sp. uw30]